MSYSVIDTFIKCLALNRLVLALQHGNAEEYFDAHASDAVTSDRTLSRLQTPMTMTDKQSQNKISTKYPMVMDVEQITLTDLQCINHEHLVACPRGTSLYNVNVKVRSLPLP